MRSKSELVGQDVLKLRTELLVTDDFRRPSLRQNASKWLLFAARACFAAAIVLIPIRYAIVLARRPVASVSSGYTDFLLYAADAAVLLMLGLWLISFALSPRRLSLGPRYIWIPLTGLTLVGWASTILSYDPLLSVYHAIRFIVLFWFYAFIVNEIHLVGWVLIPAGLQIVIQSVIALAQFISQRSVGLQAIGEYYLDPAQSGVSIVSVSGVRLLRAYGLTDHPNILGGCLAFGLLLILWAYLRASTRWTILVALVVLLLAGAGLLVTFSRSAGLALIIGALVLLIVELIDHRQKSIKRMLWLGLAWLVVLSPLLLGYPRYFGVRLNAGNSFSRPTVEQQSIGERVILIKAYSAIFMHHPWLGVGLGAAPLALKAYRPDFPTGFVPPHLSLLDAAVESGLLGGFFYLTLSVAPFVIYLTRRGTLQLGPWATIGIALLLAISVVGFFDYYTWMFLAGRLWQWLGWGFWALVSTPNSALTHSGQMSSA